MTGWTDYSADTSKQSGNYLVLHITSPEEFSVELTGGDAPVQDGEYYVFRIADPATQTIKITYGETTQDIDLGGVTGD